MRMGYELAPTECPSSTENSHHALIRHLDECLDGLFPCGGTLRQQLRVDGKASQQLRQQGSLWTIPIECSFYIILPVIGFLVGMRHVIVPMFLISLLAMPVARYFGLNPDAPGPSLFTNVHLFPFLDLASYFLAGSAAWIARNRIPFGGGMLAISLLSLYAAAGGLLSEVTLKLFLP